MAIRTAGSKPDATVSELVANLLNLPSAAAGPRDADIDWLGAWIGWQACGRRFGKGDDCACSSVSLEEKDAADWLRELELWIDRPADLQDRDVAARVAGRLTLPALRVRAIVRREE